MPQLVQSLPDGPLDLIGDVHGERDALLGLLARLGCDPDAGIAERPLVFLGDLVDDGPDSPGVVQLVRRLVDAGLAHCILGNQEVALLQGDRKPGNAWFYGRDETVAWHHDGVVEERRSPGVVLQTDPERAALLAFLETLPLAMSREDLRVVHACWCDEALARLPEQGQVGPLAEGFQRELRAELDAQDHILQAERERQRWRDLRDPEVQPDGALPALTAIRLAECDGDPIRLLSSGPQVPVPPGSRFYVGGRWRLTRRQHWWDDYDAGPAVVMGHYWRRRPGTPAPVQDVWGDTPPYGWLGPRGNVFCADYSVGQRFFERFARRTRYHGGLASLRWPERVLVFDDQGAAVPTTGWGG